MYAIQASLLAEDWSPSTEVSSRSVSIRSLSPELWLTVIQDPYAALMLFETF